MHPRIGIVTADATGQTYLATVGVKEYQWNQFLSQNSTADQTLFDAWALNLKPLLSTSYTIQSMRLINKDGAIAKEYIPGAGVAGTHTVVAYSSSATIGIGYSAPAQGLTGRGYHGSHHVKVGHADFHVAAKKSQANSVVAVINTYRNWLAANIPAAVGADIAATYKNYYTMQRNVYYQRRYGD